MMDDLSAKGTWRKTIHNVFDIQRADISVATTDSASCHSTSRAPPKVGLLETLRGIAHVCLSTAIADQDERRPKGGMAAIGQRARALSEITHGSLQTGSSGMRAFGK